MPEQLTYLDTLEDGPLSQPNSNFLKGFIIVSIGKYFMLDEFYENDLRCGSGWSHMSIFYNF